MAVLARGLQRSEVCACTASSAVSPGGTVASRHEADTTGQLISVHESVHELPTTGASVAPSGARSAGEVPGHRECGPRRPNYRSDALSVTHSYHADGTGSERHGPRVYVAADQLATGSGNGLASGMLLTIMGDGALVSAVAAASRSLSALLVAAYGARNRCPGDRRRSRTHPATALRRAIRLGRTPNRGWPAGGRGGARESLPSR